jgi:DNA-binding MarR family transcriptional regulator
MTGIIDKLQGLGFVRRRRSRHDRRIIKVTITELGKSAVDSIRDPLGWSFVH